MNARVMVAWLALAIVAFVHNTTHAYDVQLDSSTLFRAYEVRSASAGTVWSRRRFIQDLELRLSQELGEARGDRQPARVLGVVQLRLSQELGDSCFATRDRCFDPTDARVTSTYQGLATEGLLDAMLAYVEVNGLPGGLQARVGRQLWFDPIGFVRFDGLSTRLSPTPWFAVSAAAGLQTRQTSVAGSSAFEVPGTIRLDLSARQQLLASYADPPVDTWVMGSALEVGDESIVRGQLSYREMFDERGTMLRRVGVSLRSSPLDVLHLGSLAVFDVIDTALVLGTLNAHWQIDRIALRATAEVLRPRFELGSIWAYFPTATVEQGELGISADVSDVTRLGGGLRARRTHTDELADNDAGVHAFASSRLSKVTIDVDGYAWLGDLGELWAIDARASRALSSWMRIDVGASAQRINDPARANFDGVSIAEWAQLTWMLTERTQAGIELTHAYNPLVSHRFAVLASLDLGVWR